MVVLIVHWSKYNNKTVKRFSTWEQCCSYMLKCFIRDKDCLCDFIEL